MGAFGFIILQIFFKAHPVLKIGEYLTIRFRATGLFEAMPNGLLTLALKGGKGLIVFHPTSQTEKA